MSGAEGVALDPPVGRLVNEGTKGQTMTCEYCDDGDGHCVFPYYGTAPHTHALPTPTHPTDWLGSTRLLPRAEWGNNFREDPECPGQGTYLRCEKCGDGEPLPPNAS